MDKRIIFLDIDGVIRSPIPCNPSRVKIVNIKEHYARLFEDSAYLTMNESMLKNAYYDWNGEACYCIQLLLRIPNTYIVLSTSWRDFYSLDDMKRLFNLYGIGDAIIGKTKQLSFNRAKEIQTYIEEHPDVCQYVIVDDMDLSTHFTANFLLCKDHLKLSQYRLGYSILTK